MSKTQKNLTIRPPVVVILGHVDHGKSTLLDYIRKSNITEGEAGGITQHIGAYEVTCKSTDSVERRITFIDTPGHEAFAAMRSRGARVADIGVLVVAADDGVKAQTVEALKTINETKIPYLVALTKTDRPEADENRAKQQLAEAGVYVEGYGGTIPVVAVSGKTGAGISDLLETILLVADVEHFTGDKEKGAEGLVIESHRDNRKGVTATLIIKDGTMRAGDVLRIEKAISSIRGMENFLGKPVREASLSDPVRLSGLSALPSVGAPFKTFTTRALAEEANESYSETNRAAASTPLVEKFRIPIVIKADMAGTLEAIEREIAKLEQETIGLRTLISAVGTISEADVRTVLGSSEAPLIIGFNVSVDRPAKDLAERNKIQIELFDIIYKLSEWLETELARRKPVITEEFVEGKIKVIKTFSRNKDKQIMGGGVYDGAVYLGRPVKIYRHETEIGTGKILNLEQSRQKVDNVQGGKQFGAVIESKTVLFEGDQLHVIGSRTL